MTHRYECLYCDCDRDRVPNMLDDICVVCDGTLDKITLCICGDDADEVDGESCLSCIADQVRSGECDIEMMTEQLAKRVLAHMRKTPEPRITNLRIRQAS